MSKFKLIKKTKKLANSWILLFQGTTEWKKKQKQKKKNDKISKYLDLAW